jgi:hypothetical protein
MVSLSFNNVRGDGMNKPIENKLNSLIGNSGNSDVDLTVNVDIDVKPIAYGIICSEYAKGNINEQDLERAIQKLDSLIERDKKKRKSGESIPKIYDFPQQRPPFRRKWI